MLIGPELQWICHGIISSSAYDNKFCYIVKVSLVHQICFICNQVTQNLGVTFDLFLI